MKANLVSNKKKRRRFLSVIIITFVTVVLFLFINKHKIKFKTEIESHNASKAEAAILPISTESLVLLKKEIELEEKIEADGPKSVAKKFISCYKTPTHEDSIAEFECKYF